MTHPAPSEPEPGITFPARLSAGARPEILYDALPDTLIVFFNGRHSSHFVDYVSGNFALLLSPDDERVMGIQIEDFLAIEGRRHPELLHALDAAELLGITRAEAHAIAAGAGSSRPPEQRPLTASETVQALLCAVGALLEDSTGRQ